MHSPNQIRTVGPGVSPWCGLILMILRYNHFVGIEIRPINQIIIRGGDLGGLMGLRVLVIDDEIVIRRLLKMMLEHLQCNVLLACNAAEAYEVLSRQPVDVVTCDLKMPHINGLDFLTRIRTDPALKNLPVIIVTAAGFESEIAPAMKAGATAILRKPFTTQELEKVLLFSSQHSLMNA